MSDDQEYKQSGADLEDDFNREEPTRWPLWAGAVALLITAGSTNPYYRDPAITPDGMAYKDPIVNIRRTFEADMITYVQENHDSIVEMIKENARRNHGAFFIPDGDGVVVAAETYIDLSLPFISFEIQPGTTVADLNIFFQSLTGLELKGIPYHSDFPLRTEEGRAFTEIVNISLEIRNPEEYGLRNDELMAQATLYALPLDNGEYIVTGVSILTQPRPGFVNMYTFTPEVIEYLIKNQTLPEGAKFEPYSEAFKPDYPGLILN